MSLRCSKAIKAGICHADCCGLMPMEPEVWEKHKDKALCEVESIVDAEGYVIVVTPDRYCIFLDRHTYQCAIYNDRPAVCRLYGKIKDLPCPWLKRNGKFRSSRETAAIRLKIDHEVKDRLDQFVKTNPLKESNMEEDHVER